jgi:arylsulfatase A-like enzyme
MKIVVLDACALHLGYLGCYGNDWVATPNLDRLASQGFVADWHFVDTPEVALDKKLKPRSCWTGKPAYAASSASVPTLFDDLETQGVRVRRLVVSKLSFARPVLDALDWLAAPGPALLWVDGPSLAPPWKLRKEMLASYFDEESDGEKPVPWPDPPAGDQGLSDDDVLRLQNTYAAVVTFWDNQLGELCEQLEVRKFDEPMGVIVTARSGLPLGEHGTVGFVRPWLHEEVVHVPLVMRVPGLPAGRSSVLTQPADLFKFLQALFQTGVESALQGLPAAEGAEAISRWRIGDEEECAARTRAWALIVPKTDSTRPVQLYAKPDDRWEVNNLAQQHLEMVEEWQQRLQVERETAERGSITPV